MPDWTVKERMRLHIEKLTVKSKTLFLIDSIGAFLTAFLLAGILARFQDVFGMPKTILYFLSTVAFMYAIYSLVCYVSNFNNWRPYLLSIAIANSIYFFLTIGVVCYFYHRLTVLGLIYFLIEFIAMSSLILIEGNVLYNKRMITKKSRMIKNDK